MIVQSGCRFDVLTTCVSFFLLSAQRRIFDNAGYLKSMHNPKFDLIQDDVIASASGRTVKTKGGRELEADVIILSTVSLSRGGINRLPLLFR